MISFACPICNTVLNVDDRQKGAKLPCSKCGQRLQVPAHARDKTVLGKLVGADGPAPLTGKVAVLEPPPPPREALWFYTHAGKRCGPISWAQLLMRVGARKLRPADLVWTSGMPYWLAASAVPGLFATVPGVKPPSPPAAPAAEEPPPPAARVAEEPPPLPPPAPRPTGPSRWRRLATEAAAVARATATFPALLIAWPFTTLARLNRTRALRRAALDAQHALGQRLYAGKQGDDGLRAQLDTLNERIRSVEATLAPTTALKTERQGLLLRLAAPVLAQEKPPAGAEAEHDRARAAQAALLSYQEQWVADRLARRVSWRRLAVGYGVLTAVAALVLLFVFWDDLWGNEPTEVPRRLADAGQAAPRPVKSRAGREARGPARKEDPAAHKEERPTAKADRTARKAQEPARQEKKPARPEAAAQDPLAVLKKSVAYVRAGRDGGSGFLVRPGILATSARLLRATPLDQVKVYFPSAGEAGRQPLTARLLSRDRRRDLAFLAVATDLPPVPLAPAYEFQRGEGVAVVGSPGGKGGELPENVVTRGTMDAPAVLPGVDFDRLRIALPHAAAGGPVVDATGRVIGLASFRGAKAGDTAACVPLTDLRREAADASKPTREALARTAAEHDLEVVSRRAARLARLYAGVMSAYADAISRGWRTGDPQVVGANLAREQQRLGKTVAARDRELAVGMAALEARVRNDVRLPLRTRQHLADLWAIYQEMKRQVARPQGPFTTRTRELTARYRELVLALKNDLGVDDLDQ